MAFLKPMTAQMFIHDGPKNGLYDARDIILIKLFSLFFWCFMFLNFTHSLSFFLTALEMYILVDLGRLILGISVTACSRG